MRNIYRIYSTHDLEFDACARFTCHPTLKACKGKHEASQPTRHIGTIMDLLKSLTYQQKYIKSLSKTPEYSQ